MMQGRNSHLKNKNEEEMRKYTKTEGCRIEMRIWQKE
jgi:hypothetical protein